MSNRAVTGVRAGLALVCAGLMSAHGFAGPQETPKSKPSEPIAQNRAAERPREADANAIEEVGLAFVNAYNQADARALAALFDEEAEVAAEGLGSVHGRAAIEQHFTRAFEERKGEKIELKPEAITFLGPDLAREIGLAIVTPAQGPGETSRYTALFVRKDGKWLHASVIDSPDPNLTPHDHLKELEWLVGDWVDESAEAVVKTSCRWSDDGHFLIREFTFQTSGQSIGSGTQRIGWDAQQQRFRSWVFDADGGHSAGLWSQGGPGQWVIHAQGVLADGRAVEATQVLTRVSPDHAKWQSIDRSVGGQAIPDLPEIDLVRSPPEPAQAGAQPNKP